MSTPFNKTAKKGFAALFAALFLAAGIYLLIASSTAWINAGLQLFTSGEKGKDAFSGLSFSVAFIAYGLWRLITLLKKE